MRNLICGVLTLFIIGCNTNETKKEFKKTTETKENNYDFIWDFNSKKEFLYSYKHISNVLTKMSENNPADKLSITANGILKVKVKENNLADMNLTDVTAEMTKFDTYGKLLDTKSKNSLDYGGITDMTSKGNFKNPNQIPLFDLFFPLPSKALRIGESDKSSMDTENVYQLTFDGFKTIDNRKCAVLKGKIEMPNQKVPDLLKGVYENSNSGSGTYYFDLEKSHYIGADIEWSSKSIMLNNKYEGSVEMYYERISSNEIKIRLE